ncbi:hypothetical protein HCN44_003255 [Aphidius gifuensis]|uniref:Uncharacterized protein n=2 Tax=Aphidius gifuensis TaxID=684658 RepID=A0A834XI60_APHGI|nr:hypothetical protein HCN44_003255 [Aphidius gifuensis]
MISGDTAVINEGDHLMCRCSDDEYHLSPLSMKMDYVVVNFALEPTRLDDGLIYEASSHNRAITFEKKKVIYGDAGLYTCTNEKYNDEASIYVWVKTKIRAFVTRKSNETMGIAYRSHIKVPCVPTSPCFDVKLFQGSQEVAVDETNGISFDAREGFTITNPSYIHVPTEFSCKIIVNERTDSWTLKYTKFNDE